MSSDVNGPEAHWTINNADSQQAGTAATITVKGGYIQNNQLYMQGNGLVVDGLTMVGPGNTSTNDGTATIDMECTNSTVQNVLMYNLNVGYWFYQVGIQDNRNNNLLRFNTIVNNPNSYDPCIVNHSPTESLYGNLLVNPGQALLGGAAATAATIWSIPPRRSPASIIREPTISR